MNRQRSMLSTESCVSETREKRMDETIAQPNNNYHFFCHDSACTCKEDKSSHFSYYTTDTEKLVHQLDCDNQNAKPFNPCAFPSWSPIASNFEMMPGNSSNSKPTEESSHPNEKPSYSDILTKNPVNPIISSPSSPPQKSKSHCHSSSDSRHDRDCEKRRTKPLGSSKWVSLDDLDNNNEQWRANSTAQNKPKQRGQSSPELLALQNRTGKQKEQSGSNLVKNSTKGSSSKKSNMSFTDLESEVLDNVGEAEMASGEAATVVQDQRSKKPSHRKNANSERGNRETVKKQTLRKRKTNSSNRNLDYLNILISHLHLCGLMIGQFGLWLVNLIADVSIMSSSLSWHMMQVGFDIGKDKTNLIWNWTAGLYNRLLVRLGLDSSSRKSTKTKADENISLPLTREEAMKRLLSCKGKDPYSILGVSPAASDDDIKKYYKKQAFLVHPDKNRILGAEEAFKVLAHAFDIIGEPNKRKEYDLKRLEAQQIEATWNEFSDLLTQLQEKMSEAANTIKCTNCNSHHRRIKLDRPCYSARFCSPCKIMHGAREGDIWAESRMLGFIWHYFACMDGAVYDITDWAACQSKNLMHLRANTHNVQYRIISSKNHATPADTMPNDSTLEELLRAFQKKCGDPSSSSSPPSSAATKSESSNRKRKSKRK